MSEQNAPPAPQPAVADLWRRGTVDRIEERELFERLAAGRPLRVKFGMDPSSPDLHLGHAVQLMKLRTLQQAGHVVVLIVGDATAMVGDPSGRNKLRPQLTRAAVEENLVTYTEQAARVLDMARTEVRRNSEWFDAMSFEDVLRLAGRWTVARMVEREDFKKRLEAGTPIGVHEFLYPLMQGWDSVEIRCDVEFGGTDQLFNLLVGRELQRQCEQPGQVCMTMPLINGLDGRKMSKSYGNSIGLTDAPGDMFGKLMSITDEVMPQWFELLTQVPRDEVARVLAGHPREAKARLAREITAFFHGADAARAAGEAFDRQFRDKAVPDDVPEASWNAAWDAAGVPLAVLLRELGLASSSSDARRKVEQGGVRLDGEVAHDPMALVPRPAANLLIQSGKRDWRRLRG
ncbi:MAG TPA: tyrosine--tRNA ligase [Planctomycetota bacterium]|nr:tyrosine--tRNA ligase [Planctomycetota bacterium]